MLSLAIRHFCAARAGNFAVIFAVVIIPIIVCAGAALDYTRALLAHEELQEALDTAVLAAAAADVKDVEARRLEGERAFAANVQISTLNDNPELELQFDGENIHGTANSSLASSLMKLAGITDIGIEAEAASIYATKAADFYFVYDSSESMTIGDREQDLLSLAQRTSAYLRSFDPPIDKACIFACHVPEEPGQTTPFYDLAQAYNIHVRHDRLRDIILGSAQYILQGSSNMKVGLATFNIDYQLLTEPTDRLQDVTNAMDTVAVTTEDNYLFTFLGTVLPGVGQEIAAIPASPGAKKHIILLTDGVETIDFENSQFAPIDPAYCEQLRNAGDEFYVVNLVYVEPSLTSAAADRNKILPFYDDLKPNMKACAASPDHYFEAADGSDIITALTAIADEVMADTFARLTE